MSRKMIDYQVEEGKITSIDGYKVGGDELTGAAIMGVSKDSDTITRALDVDGKVKFDTKGDKTTFEIKYDIFFSSAAYNYKIVYADDIVSVNGQNAVLGKHYLVLDENNKALISNNDSLSIVADYQKLPQVPSDASTSTYVLKLVNGNSTWVTGGGSGVILRKW